MRDYTIFVALAVLLGLVLIPLAAFICLIASIFSKKTRAHMRKRPVLYSIWMLWTFAVTLHLTDIYPPFVSVHIVEAPTKALLQPYIAELASSTLYSFAQVPAGAPMIPDERIGSFGGNQQSPDGRWTLIRNSVGATYHRIDIRRGLITKEVLTLQEGDPYSGSSHHAGWSSDSKAVFITGSGRLNGSRMELTLIYLLDTETLYWVDLPSYGYIAHEHY